ncbi:MAG TPA: hypothetical protein VF743_00450 [Acidimicrobiales bacterium]
MFCGTGPAQTVWDVSADVRRRIALAHHRARALLEETNALVREQMALETAVDRVGGSLPTDDYQGLRRASGLVALDSVLGSAGRAIAAAGGGLWCGGDPRPWPATGWQLDDEQT